MEVFDILLQAGFITSAIVAYLLIFRRTVPKKGKYKKAGWNYPLKILYARYAVHCWKRKLSPKVISEEPNASQSEGWDAVSLRGTAPDGTTVFLSIRKLCERKPLSEIIVFVKLSDGTTYVLPHNPILGSWENVTEGWSANGLKIQVLEPELRLRILYNGLMKRTQDNVTQHVTFNFIWVAATSAIRHPEDWSNELAAEALAIEPWKDSNWSDMLGKWKDGSWHQFGSAQGRFQSYNSDGSEDKSEYLRIRGLRERSWAPHGYQPVRRSVYLTAATKDGTVVQLKCLSYKNVLTECISGSVRQPNYDVETVTSTDLVMSEFYETSKAEVKSYTINVSTKSRNLKVIIRMNNVKEELYSGVNYQHQFVYKTFIADIDGYGGSGILELGYIVSEVKDLIIPTPAPVLKWLSPSEAGDVGYCVSFEHRAAACTEYVGGKGASLALLASIQKENGYKVPPGFCLTIKALDKYLEQNPQIKAAIKEIQAANENYDENIFKQKCEKASSMFINTEITGELKSEIQAHMTELRKKASDENYGTDARFAVRSSAVGEDSEVLSAAGQNETILGCITDDDVLKGVQKCWASMFAFTSAYYRRQNGQPCYCGGGVVVQTLARAHAAGVMFTRHPARGHPELILITANYGLGESVVSGTVEPDTFIVRREGSNLTIDRVVIGAKKQRVTVSDQGEGGVCMQSIDADEQRAACVSHRDVLRLARRGARLEELWAAPRDIEWAIIDDDIYLLQARPITSLDRWSEEELLHELDDPTMADDEIISFGNTGEVLPRPMTAMTNDLVKTPLTTGINLVMGKDKNCYDHSILTTHNRCALSLYNSIYKKVPKEVDINIRMIEMAVHGHKVADDEIMSTALHRRLPRIYDKVEMILLLLKSLLTSKRVMNSSIQKSTSMSSGEDIEDISKLYEFIEENCQTMQNLAANHSLTSTASTSSQFIAMSVLLEGRSEFSPELCNEISTLLSSGDVLSAEVPHGLARLARRLEESGRYQEYRNIPHKEAFDWLKAQLPEVYKEVCQFLQQHGHRAIMEFDLSTKPWILVPEEMMKVLQSLQASKEENQKTKTDDEIIASLASPQKSSTRKVLRWVMPLCRRTVRHREGTKAHLILGVHKLRLAFLRLAKLMVKEWYLPHPDLIFFFRFHELKSYIQNRDPGLLRKAIQRHQYYPKWCKLKFAEINKGWLTPLESQGPFVTAGDVKIEAASVCGGEVVARACVVKDLSEIDQLQQGDVLITHATDIGWSPYFPLITGIVTELGGLISHGAVIAREYGLPCIVGAANATDIFKTGDIVRLSGTKGTLERVQVSDKSDLNDQNNADKLLAA